MQFLLECSQSEQKMLSLSQGFDKMTSFNILWAEKLSLHEYIQGCEIQRKNTLRRNSRFQTILHLDHTESLGEVVINWRCLYLSQPKPQQLLWKSNDHAGQSDISGSLSSKVSTIYPHVYDRSAHKDLEVSTFENRELCTILNLYQINMYKHWINKIVL